MAWWMRIGLLVVVLLGGLYAYNMLGDDVGATGNKTTELESVGSKCLEIRERATAHIVPIIEFQQLELASRRANVFAQCMEDHGFELNPNWQGYAEPVATARAKAESISTSEAMELLKREHMVLLAEKSGQPLYWQRSKVGGKD
jgi:hypothetical protein